jgi:hypothetical protein
MLQVHDVMIDVITASIIVSQTYNCGSDKWIGPRFDAAAVQEQFFGWQ